MVRRASPWLLGFVLAGCGGSGGTDVPDPSPTAVARVEVQVPADTLVVGDSVSATLRAVNARGDVVTPATVVWSSSDSGTAAVTPGGVLRGRNVGTMRLEVAAGSAVGVKTIHVVPRAAMRLRLVAPDTVRIDAALEVQSVAETAAGVALAEVAPRFASSDTNVATVEAVAPGRAAVRLVGPGAADLLAVVGRDTTRRRLTVTLATLRSLQLSIEQRVLPVRDSLPYTITAIDASGRAVPSTGTVLSFEPAGTVLVRNGHLLVGAIGRVVVQAKYGSAIALDTITAQGPSEFPLDIVDGDGQNPLPLRVRLSMERVAARWRSVIRTAPPGEFVRLAVGECRNVTPVSQFITGVRVLVTMDSLPTRIAAQGGPCVMRAGGLPLLGTLQVNIFTLGQLSDRKLDDLIQHEVGHVLGIGSLWSRGGSQAGLVAGDAQSADPIFVGPNALAAFERLGRAGFFAGRRVPLEVRVLGHWRADAFSGEVMAPSLTLNAPQPTSSVTVAALRDLGWNVELGAYEEYVLPELVTSQRIAVPGGVAARVAPAAAMELSGDVLPPLLQLLPGGARVRLDGRTWPFK